MVAAQQALADDYAEKINRRVQLLRFDSMRLTQDGKEHRPDDARQLTADESLFVAVGQRRGFVRIVAETYGIRLLVWQSQRNLAEVVARSTHLSLREDQPLQDKNVGIELLPGLRVKQLEQHLKNTKLRYSDGIVAFEGWLPSKALGRVYSLAKPTEKDSSNHAVQLPAEVYASPGGAALAHFVSKPLVQVLGGDVKGYTRVVYRSSVANHERGAVVVRGFMKSKLLNKVAIGLGSLGTMGGSGMWGGSHVIYLDPGTRLYASSKGALVGKVLQKVPARGQHYDVSKRRWYSVLINTDWDFVPVWLDAAERKVAKSPTP